MVRDLVKKINETITIVNEERRVKEEQEKKLKEAIERRIREEKEWEKRFNEYLDSIPRVEVTLSDEKVLRKKEINTPYSKGTTITKRTSSKRYRDFVVVDTETTGLKVGGNDIIEVSAIRFEDCKPVSIYTTLLTRVGQ